MLRRAGRHEEVPFSDGGFGRFQVAEIAGGPDCGPIRSRRSAAEWLAAGPEVRRKRRQSARRRREECTHLHAMSRADPAVVYLNVEAVGLVAASGAMLQADELYVIGDWRGRLK